MEIEVHLKDQSQPILCKSVRNAYIKGPFYCVMYTDLIVDKFPVENIFRVRERTVL